MKPYDVIGLDTRVTYSHGFGLLQVVPSAKNLSMSFIYLQNTIDKLRLVEFLLCYVSV